MKVIQNLCKEFESFSPATEKPPLLCGGFSLSVCISGLISTGNVYNVPVVSQVCKRFFRVKAESFCHEKNRRLQPVVLFSMGLLSGDSDTVKGDIRKAAVAILQRIAADSADLLQHIRHAAADHGLRQSAGDFPVLDQETVLGYAGVFAAWRG